MNKKIVGFLSLLLAFGPTVIAQRNVVDEVVWVVGDEAILLSDVEEQRLRAEYEGTPIPGNPYCYIPEQLALQKLYLDQARIDSININEFWDAQIEQIYVREDQKIELIPRVGDAVIILGKLDNYAEKLDNLYHLYQKGFNVMGWNHYSTIDLQYKNQIVCTRNTAKPHIVKQIEQQNDTTVVKAL